ncbi:Gfo/Idh/MocA family oxidoreductase [Anaerolineales bacterium HSG24]|nr:Gfo/Idh/MocA family oxidoreductase [Anaerolineales bacterium HSG24]
MKIGIVGTGSMGRTHAEGWTESKATIAGFLGSTPEQAKPLADMYQAQVYSDFATMLADVDVVDICTPTHLHHDMVLQAAEAGKDIVCEKPLARTAEQAQAMIHACRTAGVKLMVAHVVRFFPEYAQAKAIVAQGDIGQPAVVRLTRGSSRPNKGNVNWFTDLEKSGGMMLDLMIHDFDYARWISGEVKTVFAKNISSKHPDAPVDYGLVILTHHSGAISHVEGSWAYPPPMFRTRFEIATANGWLEHDSDKSVAIGLHLHQQETATTDVPLPSSPLSESPYAAQLKAFYNHIAHDAPLPISAEDGLAALQIALAALESAQIGQPVTLTPPPEVQA